MAASDFLRLERVAAALRLLAACTNADRLERIMRFVCLLLEEAARDPGLFARVTRGTLVVELRAAGGNADLVLGADDGRALTELLSCELPFVSFHAVSQFVARRSADFGNAFVLIGDDVVSVSVLAEVDLDEAPTDAPATVQADLFDDVFERETALTARWDVDATVIYSPDAALLELLALPGAGPPARDPSDRNARKRQ